MDSSFGRRDFSLATPVIGIQGLCLNIFVSFQGLSLHSLWFLPLSRLDLILLAFHRFGIFIEDIGVFCLKIFMSWELSDIRIKWCVLFLVGWPLVWVFLLSDFFKDVYHGDNFSELRIRKDVGRRRPGGASQKLLWNVDAFADARVQTLIEVFFNIGIFVFIIRLFFSENWWAYPLRIWVRKQKQLFFCLKSWIFRRPEIVYTLAHLARILILFIGYSCRLHWFRSDSCALGNNFWFVLFFIIA